MPLIKLVPLCVLAAILMVVAYNMFNVRAMLAYRKSPKSDLAVLVCSCVLTFAFDLVFAIEVGMVLSCALFMKRMSDVTQIEGWKYITDMDYEKQDETELKNVPEHVLVYEISGPLFFAASDKMVNIERGLRSDTKVVILRMRSVPAIDSTALDNLHDMYLSLKKKDISLVFSHLNPQPEQAFNKRGFDVEVGEENIQTNIDAALQRAYNIVKGE